MSQDRITVDELNRWLLQAPLSRRRAILFGLETKIPISRIIELTWKDFPSLSVSTSPYGMSLIKATTRHIRLRYIFWEHMGSAIAGPLFGLEQTVMDVSQGLGYTALQRLYDTAIPIDSRADHSDFVARFREEYFARISRG